MSTNGKYLMTKHQGEKRTIRTQNLQSDALDFAASVAMDNLPDRFAFRESTGFLFEKIHHLDDRKVFNWLESEKISLSINDSGVWIASDQYHYGDEPKHIMSGNSPREAILRTIVSKHLGESVEIPLECVGVEFIKARGRVVDLDDSGFSVLKYNGNKVDIPSDLIAGHEKASSIKEGSLINISIKTENGVAVGIEKLDIKNEVQR